MALGDSFFDLVTTGSTATSTTGAHLLFGANQSLSLLGNNEVVNISLAATVLDARVWDSTVTNNKGLRLTFATSAFDLPPMRVGAASILHFSRDGTTGDPTLLYSVFRRRPGNSTL